MILEDLRAFEQPKLDHRFLHGGRPRFFLASTVPERDFQEWMDAYWAKDVQSLFRLDRRASFERFAELLMTRSGGMFEATAFTRPCEVSRQTLLTSCVHFPLTGRRKSYRRRRSMLTWTALI